MVRVNCQNGNGGGSCVGDFGLKISIYLDNSAGADCIYHVMQHRYACGEREGLPKEVGVECSGYPYAGKRED